MRITTTTSNRPIIKSRGSVNPLKWRPDYIPETNSPFPVSSFLQVITPDLLSADQYLGEWIQFTEIDRVSKRRAARNIRTLLRFIPRYRTTQINPQVLFESLTPDVVTVDQNGNTRWVSDGIAIIRTSIVGTDLSTDVTFFVVSSVDGEVVHHVTFVEGSLARNCEHAVDNRIQNASTAIMPIFSTQNHSSQVYTRNPNCWIYDLRQAATCISPWNSSGGTTRAGTLITPRHILFAAHYEIGDGATIRFVTADNQVVNRVMLRKRRHPLYNPFYPDLTIGVLDSDVPASITPCKVLPPNYNDYFPTTPAFVPCLALDQQERATVTTLGSFSYDGMFAQMGTRPQDNPDVEIMWIKKIGGDSGNPVFLIVNNQLVLLTVWTSPGSGTFISKSNIFADCNQMIADVDALAGNGGTGYQLTEIDLSGFTNFSSL